MVERMCLEEEGRGGVTTVKLRCENVANTVNIRYCNIHTVNI